MGISNFPPQTMPFVGRSSELSEIAARLSDPVCRLLTLVGPGGIGKTRLALEVGQQIAYPDGIYFVSLQPLTSAEFIVSAIAEALRFLFHDDQDVRTQLLNFLCTKHLLLMLDNFEHLLDGADLLLEILEVAPQVKLLVTSRERLRLREEWVMDVHGLPFPEHEHEASAQDYGAVQLFAQSTSRIGATLRMEDLTYVAQICQMVGGIPLAIELAASWTRALSCQQISHELARSLDILETSLRNTEPRHRTMRTTFEPTWQRLTQDEQAVFMRLSVFRGGFTADAAEQVAGALLRTLSALVDKSLLRHHENGRYDLHELLRQYGEERLEAAGLGDHTRDAHSAYYAAFIYSRVDDLKGRRQIEAITEINTDFENLRTAWTWAADRRHEGIVEQMIDGLWVYCQIRHRGQEGFALFRYAEQRFVHQQGKTAQRIWGRLLARTAGKEKSQVQIETALEMARRFNDPMEIAFCLAESGYVAYMNQEFDKAIQLYEQSLAIYRQLGDHYNTAEVLFERIVNDHRSNRDYLKYYGDEVLRLRREIGDRIGTGWSLATAAIHEGRLGNFAEAERLWLERVTLGHELGNLALVATGYGHVSHKVYFFQGDFAQARATADEAIKLGTRIDSANALGWALPTLGLLASMNEDYSEGKRLCQQATTLKTFADIDKLAAWGLAIASCGLGDYEAARAHLAEAFKYLTNIQGVVGAIASLPIAAIILAHRGNPVRAVELLALAFTHPVRADGWMRKWPLLARFQTALKQQLGPDVYAAAWERGKLLDVDETVVELKQQFPTSPLADKEPSGQWVDLLTKRELEILRLVAEGCSNKEIANRLYVGVSTVKKHINHIYDKLDAKNRTGAVVRARELNLLQ